MPTQFTPDTVTNVNSSSGLATVNENFTNIALELDKIIYADGSKPLTDNLDADSNRILNLPSPVSSGEPLTLGSASSLLTINKGDPGSPGEGYATVAALATAGNTATNLDDAYLSESGREGKFIFSTANLSSYVTIDTLKGIFIPPANATSGASGAWVRQDYTHILPDFFGSTLDSSTAHEKIQIALELAPLLGKPVGFPDRLIETKYPVYVFSNTEIVGLGPSAGLNNTLTAAAAAGIGGATAQTAMFMGCYHPAYMSHVTGSGDGASGGNAVRYITYHNGGAITAGSREFTCSTAAQASNYSKGDIIWVRDIRYTSGPNSGVGTQGRNHQPLYCASNVVEEDGDPVTGVVVLKYPILKDIPGTSLIAQANSPIDPDTATVSMDFLGNYPLYVCYNSRVKNISLLSTEGNPLMRASLLGCDVDFNVTSGEAASGGNSFCFTTAMYRNAQATRKILEMAQGSVGSDITVVTATFRWVTGVSGGNSLIRLGENSHKNKIDIINLTVDNFDDAGATFLSFGDTTDNIVIVRDCQIAAGTFGTVVAFSNDAVGSHDPSQTQNETSGNTVKGKFTLASGVTFSRFVYFVDTGLLCDNNTVEADFYGTPGTSAVTFQGDGNTFRGYLENGSVSNSAGTNATLEASGGFTLSSYARSNYLKTTVNGHKFRSSTNNETNNTAGAPLSYSINMSHTDTRVTLTNAGCTGFQIASPTNGADGVVCRLEVVNNTGNSFTPSFTSVWKLNGASVGTVADGESFTVLFERVVGAGGAARYILRAPLTSAY